MNLFRILCILSILTSLAGSISAQYNWSLKRNIEGIKISTRQSDRSKFNDIKVEMDLQGNIYQLAAILLDVDKYTQWSYSTKRSMLIKKVSPGKLVYYSEISAPWPVMNRDLYAYLEVNVDSVFQSLKVVSIGEKDYRPIKKNLVRIPYSKGNWIITTVSNKIIHLVYVLEVDPGGSVPAWILNLFATRAPLETFENLKHKMILLNSSNKYQISKANFEFGVK